MTLGGNFSILTSSEKNSFVYYAYGTGNTGKQAAIIGGAIAVGGIGLLLITGGVAFVVPSCATTDKET